MERAARQSELAIRVYLAIADDAAIGRVTSNGVAGTSMPAFAQHSGGMLTDEQINVIVRGIRTRWAKPGCTAARVRPRMPRRLMPPQTPAIPSVEPPHIALIVRPVTARTAAEASGQFHRGCLVSGIGERPVPSHDGDCRKARIGRSRLARRHSRQTRCRPTMFPMWWLG